MKAIKYPGYSRIFLSSGMNSYGSMRICVADVALEYTQQYDSKKILQKTHKAPPTTSKNVNSLL